MTGNSPTRDEIDKARATLLSQRRMRAEREARTARQKEARRRAAKELADEAERQRTEAQAAQQDSAHPREFVTYRDVFGADAERELLGGN